LLAVVAALAVAPAAAAEIVYMKGPFDQQGTTLVAMNDDGSGAHTLLTGSQVPPNDRVGLPSLQPSSSTLAFEGITDEYDSVNGDHFGDDGANYGGLYVMANGSVSRLSAPPAPTIGIGSEDTSPALTADGRVVYESIVNSYDSGSNLTGSVSRLLVRSVAGGSPSAWSTSPANSYLSWAADPANGGLIAYFDDTSPDQLVIGNQAASSATVVVTQPSGAEPAWSPDGTALADVDWTTMTNSGTDGFNAGLWIFHATGSAQPKELVVDPNPPIFGAGSFSNPVWVGGNEVAFAATIGGATNIYEAPDSCDQCTISSPQVKQLTTDGTANAPDAYPAWTSQTITPHGGGTKFGVIVTASHGQKVLQQKGLVETVTCNLACVASAVGEVQIKGIKKPLFTKVVRGALTAGAHVEATLPLSKSELGKIKTALKHHRRVTAQVGAVAEDAASQTAQATASFAVKH
jgi:hypothetical protein